MHVFVTGATGLIGSAICARLASEGHEVTAAVRPPAGRKVSGAFRIVPIDLKQAAQADWEPFLRDVDAVVNCAGVLQDSPRESTQAVHAEGAAALFSACEACDVRRIIHFSAIGVDRGALSEFSRTKLAGDQALMTRDLDWVILRPSVVLGRGAFGASALFRGLAALPWLISMPGAGPLQVVQLEDVLRTVSFFLQPDAPRRVSLELAGPERLSMAEVVAEYRAWLGWRGAQRFALPAWAAAGLYRLGDAAGMLGWRPAMRSTAGKEIARGAVGDPGPWMAMTGISPQPLAQALQAEPATVQERWFAKLYFLKPVVFVVFAGFWILTGIISLTNGWESGLDLMRRAGLAQVAAPGVIAGALADLAIGLAIAWRPTARLGLWAALGLSLFYVCAGTILLPELWNEPLGPLTKIWPIMALNLVALAILDER